MAQIPLGNVLAAHAAATPDFPAVTCGNRTLSRVQLEARANRLARAYELLGVGQDDFVTIALPNSVEFVEALLAVWKLGATPAPVSPKLPDREREAIVALADPALIVGVPDGSHPGRTTVPQGYEPPASISNDPIEPARIATAWKAPTSGGSTGRPKLIVSGQSSLYETETGRGMGMQDDGVTLIPGPLYHNAPLGMVTGALAMGNHIVVMPKFDALGALEAIGRHRVDHVNLVPTMMLRMWRALQDNPGRFDVSSLQVVWHMAAPCPAWLKEEWINLVGPDHLFELYGGTEAQSFTVITGTEWLAHRGSVGKPVFGEMAIFGPDGVELPPGEVGEIYLRTPDGASTYRYIGAEARVRDGWESLGDMGWKDEDGYLYISDRRTDLILSGGANIYPAEVESALSEHPMVDTAVVVGVPDDDLGQRVHAVVQTVASGAVSADELIAFLGERLVRYKIPRSFRFVDEALRDDAGKVRRSAIRDEEIARLAHTP